MATLGRHFFLNFFKFFLMPLNRKFNSDSNDILDMGICKQETFLKFHQKFVFICYPIVIMQSNLQISQFQILHCFFKFRYHYLWNGWVNFDETNVIGKVTKFIRRLVWGIFEFPLHISMICTKVYLFFLNFKTSI